MRLEKRINKKLEELALAVLGIRATGGYRYRKDVPLSDKEIDTWVDHAIKALQEMTVNLFVAESPC